MFVKADGESRRKNYWSQGSKEMDSGVRDLQGGPYSLTRIESATRLDCYPSARRASSCSRVRSAGVPQAPQDGPQAGSIYQLRTLRRQADGQTSQR